MRKLITALFIAICGLCAGAVVIPDGVYTIWTSYEGLYCIDVSNSRMADGSNIQLWDHNNSNAQHWKVENRDGAIVIRSTINSDYVIDVSNSRMADGTNIQLWPYNGTKAQLWYPYSVGGQKYILRSAINPNYVIDLSASRVARGTNIQLWTRNNTGAQTWIFQKVKNSY